MKHLILFFLLISLLFFASCGKESDQALIIANLIIQDVGKVKYSSPGDVDKLIIVFEETHLSRRGQIEMAIMFNRLYQQYGLRKICLEGAIADSGRIDPSWYHNLKSPSDDNEKQFIARQQLKEGEISSAEFMALVFPNLSVVGIEDANEYSVELGNVGNPSTIYLFYIAFKSLSNTNAEKFMQLYNKATAEKEGGDPNLIFEAMEFAINSNSWTSEKYKFLTEKDQIFSTTKILDILNEIENYAKSKGVLNEIDSKTVESMQSLKKFYETADLRSKTMVKNTLLHVEGNIPTAMVIGAAHTDLVTELLNKEKACFAIISPLSLTGESYSNDSTNISIDAFIRKGNSQSVDENSLGDFLDGNRKPPSVINRQWFINKTKIYLITRRLSSLVAGGNPPNIPPRNGDELQEMYFDKYGNGDNNVLIDWKSVEIGPNRQVVVAVNTKDENGKPTKIWINAIKIDTEVAKSSLEQQLLDDLEDLKEDNPMESIAENKTKVKKIVNDVVVAFSLSKQAVSSLNLQAALR